MGNKRIVVDASIVLKWYHPEADSPAALKILDRIESHDIIAFAPDLLIYEMLNAWIRGMGNDAREVPSILNSLSTMSLIVVSPEPTILSEAALLAAEHTRLSVYDATYLALAIQQQATLITADQKLKIIADELNTGVVHLLSNFSQLS